MNFVIDKVTTELKRFGCCNFENDGSFDSETEQIIQSNSIENFDKDYKYIWNFETEEFDKSEFKISDDRKVILRNIMLTAEQTEQLPRLLDALDNYPSFLAALDNANWDLARSRVDKAKTEGKITQDDYNLVNLNIPG